ncbi:MAG: hypothetical protein ICV51_18025 [Flavisolibacter sp.]|nr:hypothetical protein [Flavisolibacter sp.]MBD0366938.1 hypothetical protein [Flavisolibacter sp.]MBD0377511.1 hypothetical protein [Flavisolibacter sp.]
MRFLLTILLTALLTFIAGLFLPWWSVALVAFIIALLLPQTIGLSFLTGFLGVFIIWMIIAAWIDVANDHILSTKMAQLFPLGGSSVLIMLVSALVGALVGGFAAMSGSSLRRLFYR